MSSFSVQKAALEGQPGLVRSLLADDAKLINAKDDVSYVPMTRLSSLGDFARTASATIPSAASKFIVAAIRGWGWGREHGS